MREREREKKPASSGFSHQMGLGGKFLAACLPIHCIADAPADLKEKGVEGRRTDGRGGEELTKAATRVAI